MEKYYPKMDLKWTKTTDGKNETLLSILKLPGFKSPSNYENLEFDISNMTFVMRWKITFVTLPVKNLILVSFQH